MGNVSYKDGMSQSLQNTLDDPAEWRALGHRLLVSGYILWQRYSLSFNGTSQEDPEMQGNFHVVRFLYTRSIEAYCKGMNPSLVSEKHCLTKILPKTGIDISSITKGELECLEYYNTDGLYRAPMKHRFDKYPVGHLDEEQFFALVSKIIYRLKDKDLQIRDYKNYIPVAPPRDASI